MKKRLAIFDPNRLRRNVADWFGERVDLRPLAAAAAKKTVPVHRRSWIYLLGGTALFLFGLQVAGGALLMLYYQPSEASAHESVRRIATEVPLGQLVRSVHVWGANFFIAVVGLHFLVKLFARAYRRPREMTWISGMLLLGLALAFGFSGYLLPWNELSYYATQAGTKIPGTLPVVGDGIVQLLRGGQRVTGDTIPRFFAAHVMFLPLVSGLFLAVHLGLIQGQGMSLPIGKSKADVPDAMPFFSEFLPIELCVWLLVFGTIVTLATLLPPEIGVEADRLADPTQEIKPEWYFLFMFQTLKILDPAVFHVDGELLETLGVLFFAAVGAFLLLVPFLDRKAAREESSPRFTAAFVLLMAYAAVFEIWAIVTPGGGGHSAEAAATGVDVAGSLLSLAMLWAVIGFLVFYLLQLRKENARIRRLYGGSPGEAPSSDE